MKLPLLLTLALGCTACDKVISSADSTPEPATATPPPASPAPKPGAWMNESKSGLDRSGALGGKSGGEQKKK